MKRFRIWPLLVVWMPAPAGQARADHLGEPPADFQRGVNYAHSWRGEGGYGTARSGETLAELHGLGVRWVALMPFGFMDRVGAREIRTIYDHPGAESDARMARDIAVARKLGMETMLKPHLWIRGGTWPGEIAFEADEEFEAWFAEYARMILHYAAFAEREGVASLAIGNELKGVSGRRPELWRELIGQVREVYGGKVLYAANWDEYEQVPWWDALDEVGVNAYFPLVRETRGEGEAGPTEAELAAGAERVVARLERIAEETGRRVVLTEIGYRSAEGAAGRPWEQEGGREDAELQRRCYEAVMRALAGSESVAGVYWWKWFSGPHDGGEGSEATEFSPRGKPAAEAMAHWYGGAM